MKHEAGVMAQDTNDDKVIRLADIGIGGTRKLLLECLDRLVHCSITVPTDLRI